MNTTRGTTAMGPAMCMHVRESYDGDCRDCLRETIAQLEADLAAKEQTIVEVCQFHTHSAELSAASYDLLKWYAERTLQQDSAICLLMAVIVKDNRGETLKGDLALRQLREWDAKNPKPFIGAT